MLAVIVDVILDLAHQSGICDFAHTHMRRSMLENFGLSLCVNSD